MDGHENCAHDSTFGDLRDCLLRRMRELGPAGEAWADQSEMHLRSVLLGVRPEDRPATPPGPSMERF